MRRFIAVLIAAVLLLGTTSVISYAESEDRCLIYVAADGSDSNEGTLNAPLATLKGARDKIRELKSSGANYAKGYVVNVRGGTYNFSEGLVLTEDDSGTETAPIIYRNYGEEKVTFAGGISISGSQFSKLADPEIQKRIIDSAARDKIYTLDLKALGITDLGEPYWPGAYSYYYFAQAGLLEEPKAPGGELFFNGEVMHIARYPNDGYLNVAQVIDKGWANGSTTVPIGTPFKIVVNDDRIAQWSQNPADSILMYGFWKYDWADQTVPIRSINVENNQIESAISGAFGVEAGKPFYVFDLIEELDQAGEYYIDRNSGILYLYPPSNIASANITMSIMEEPLIRLEDASNIQFKNFNVTATRNSAFVINGGQNNEISGCDISYTAKRAVQISGTNNGIVDSHIYEVNGGVLLSGGDIPALTPGNCYATNNHIERYSRITKTYLGGVDLGGVGNIISHNKIHNGPHLAIQFGGQSHKIMYNEIYDVVKSSDDAGAIYGGLDWVGRGHEIKYNYIHDLISDRPIDCGVGAIYLDGGQCELYMVGNVIENVNGSAFWINGGRDNVVINNIIVNCTQGLRGNDIMLDVMDAINGNAGLGMYHEKVDNSPYINSCIWQKTYPKLQEMLKLPDEEKCLPEGNVYANNLLYASKVAWLHGRNPLPYYDTSKNLLSTGDPGFYDLEGRDYTLKPDAAVFNELPGFKAVPFTRMGLSDERAEVRVQEAVIMQIGSPYSLVNGARTQIDENPQVKPILLDGVTYVPLRFLAESLGAEVSFDEATGKITIATNEISLELTIGSKTAVKNGEEVTLTSAPIVLEERTLVPLRSISELFEKSVFWHESGFISISDDPNLFDGENGTDDDIISYTNNKINIY